GLREEELAARLRSTAHRGDLRAHAGAVALVEVDDAVEVVVVGRPRVHREEALGEVDAPAPLEIHREERDVRSDVAEAVAVVELDPVDHVEIEALGVEEDVLEAEVAVPI